MKIIFTSILLCIAILPINAQEPSMEFEFTTIDIGGFPHERHVLAVWVETAEEEFVKTQLVYADIRKVDLYTWNAAPANGNEVDAITGATQEYHKTYTVPWNCLDLEGNVIPIGDYVLHLEMNNNHYQGPLAEIEFTIDGNNFVLTPDDEEFFKNISLTYNNGDIKVNPITVEVLAAEVSPNPVNDYLKIVLNKDCKTALVELYNINGELLNSKVMASENSLNVKNLSAGVYLVKIITDKGMVTRKILK